MVFTCVLQYMCIYNLVNVFMSKISMNNNAAFMHFIFYGQFPLESVVSEAYRQVEFKNSLGLLTDGADSMVEFIRGRVYKEVEFLSIF